MTSTQRDIPVENTHKETTPSTSKSFFPTFLFVVPFSTFLGAGSCVMTISILSDVLNDGGFLWGKVGGQGGGIPILYRFRHADLPKNMIA